MTLENFENIVSLLCVVMGLIYCCFKYIDRPRRGYAYLIGFFLAFFVGEYYWAIYVIITHSYPDVSELLTYLGWNIAIVFLLLAVVTMRSEKAKRYFHPVMLLPILLNIPQFIIYVSWDGKLYVSFVGFMNNLWQVGVTTITAVICVQELMYYLKTKKERKDFPWFDLIVIIYLALKYGAWTASCFEWNRELLLLSPYLYCSVLSSMFCVFFVYGASDYYKAKDSQLPEVDTIEQEFVILAQTILCFVIVGLSAGGYFIAAILNKTGLDKYPVLEKLGINGILFVISVFLVILVMFFLFVLLSRFRYFTIGSKRINKRDRGRISFVYMIILTFILIAGVVIYYNVILYRSSVISVYEEGENKLKETATGIENYLTAAVKTLRADADRVDLMVERGDSTQDIHKYLTDQTQIHSEQFDESFAGMYAYIGGKYINGFLGRGEPPEGYEPTSRKWYKDAVDADGDVVIVTPYVDAQTGSTVITVAKKISNTPGKKDQTQNIVCLDLLYNHIKEVTEKIDIAGKGYGMLIADDGFIIAHNNEEYNGGYISDYYGQSILESILNTNNGRVSALMMDEDCTLFVRPVMDQWYLVAVVGNSELFEETYSQLAIGIMLSIVIFGFIAFFYYLGYKNDQMSARKIERMNLQIVSALASAIDAKDTYTNGHSSRVAEYSRMIAERAGYSKSDQDEIYMMGLLHDVGKIGVPDEIINKPSKLSDEEFELIKKHPVTGSEILERIQEKPKLATGARWHHERYGGGGYPDGISGEDIPVEARIIAVADAYDAMTSKRSYRDVMQQDKVRLEIEKGIGTQFDPQFAKIMIEIIDEDIDYGLHEK